MEPDSSHRAQAGRKSGRLFELRSDPSFVNSGFFDDFRVPGGGVARQMPPPWICSAVRVCLREWLRPGATSRETVPWR